MNIHDQILNDAKLIASEYSLYGEPAAGVCLTRIINEKKLALHEQVALANTAVIMIRRYQEAA